MFFLLNNLCLLTLRPPNSINKSYSETVSKGQSGRDVQLTTHFHLVSRFSWTVAHFNKWTEEQFYTELAVTNEHWDTTEVDCTLCFRSV